jgi:hypothetical protein
VLTLSYSQSTPLCCRAQAGGWFVFVIASKSLFHAASRLLLEHPFLSACAFLVFLLRISRCRRERRGCHRQAYHVLGSSVRGCAACAGLNTGPIFDVAQQRQPSAAVIMDATDRTTRPADATSDIHSTTFEDKPSEQSFTSSQPVQDDHDAATNRTQEKQKHVTEGDEALEPVVSKHPSVRDASSIPNGGLWAWLQVLGGFFLLFNSWYVLSSIVHAEPCTYFDLS